MLANGANDQIIGAEVPWWGRRSFWGTTQEIDMQKVSWSLKSHVCPFPETALPDAYARCQQP